MIEAYDAITELYLAELKKLDGGPMTSEEQTIWTARMDAFREAQHAVFKLMFPQDDKKAADECNRQQPEK
jgi:hypothetical protein